MTTSRCRSSRWRTSSASIPKLDAFIPTGGFPQFIPQAYKKVAEKYKARIADGSLALVVADTLPVQIDLLKAGLSKGQVGQRPFEMGYKSHALPEGHQGRQAGAEGPDLHGPRRLHAGDRRHLRRQVSAVAYPPSSPKGRAEGPSLNRRSPDFATLQAASLGTTESRPAPAGKAAAQRLLTGDLGG